MSTKKEGKKRNTIDQLVKVKIKFALRPCIKEITSVVSCYLVCPPLIKPKKRRIGKPPSKRRDMRHEVEEEEMWELPKHSVCKGWYTIMCTKITATGIFAILGTNLFWFELQGCWIVCEIIANAMHGDKVGVKLAKLRALNHLA